MTRAALYAGWLTLLIAACWTPVPINRTLDDDPIRAHFYHARDTFAAMCGCVQDVVAIVDPDESTASVSGALVRYNPEWFRAQMLRFGTDAAFVVFAHELAHVEAARSNGHRVQTFSDVKAQELACDRRAGCAAAMANLSKSAGAESLAWFLEDLRHHGGEVRAQAFRAGYEGCE